MHPLRVDYYIRAQRIALANLIKNVNFETLCAETINVIKWLSEILCKFKSEMTLKLRKNVWRSIARMKRARVATFNLIFSSVVLGSHPLPLPPTEILRHTARIRWMPDNMFASFCIIGLTARTYLDERRCAQTSEFCGFARGWRGGVESSDAVERRRSYGAHWSRHGPGWTTARDLQH